jgi:hypothetical protein
MQYSEELNIDLAMKCYKIFMTYNYDLDLIQNHKEEQSIIDNVKKRLWYLSINDIYNHIKKHFNKSGSNTTLQSCLNYIAEVENYNLHFEDLNFNILIINENDLDSNIEVKKLHNINLNRF